MKEKERASRTVWMIIASFYPWVGGAERQVQRLSRALIARGWSVSVLTRRHGFPHLHGLPASDVVDGIPIFRVHSHGTGKIGSFLYVLTGLWHLMRYGRHGIYHAHDVGASAWIAVIARYLLGGRCIIKLRTGRDLYEKRLFSRASRWQFSALLRLVDRIVVVNSEVEDMVLTLGIPATRVVRIPNSVDTKVFYPVSSNEKLAARKRLGLPMRKTIILYVGRLEPIKGVDILLRAWALLPEDVRLEALLVVVGDGSERENLLHLMSEFRVSESVLLAGAQESTRDYYWAGDIFVLPSRTEGLSNALIEAMACGLPVVASKTGGALDIVKEGENGLLFDVANSTQLMRKLSWMITNRDQWKEMGTYARQSVQIYADLEMAAGYLDKVYKALLWG